MAENPQAIKISGRWVENVDTPIHFSNAFAVSPVSNEFILTFGCAIPPVVTPDMTPAEVAKLKMPIKPLVRIGMTPERVIELIQLLQAQLNAYSHTITS
jgi:hypothetical protein